LLRDRTLRPNPASKVLSDYVAWPTLIEPKSQNTAILRLFRC
jgi:hypothetical protein